jgi:hypothetical protein
VLGVRCCSLGSTRRRVSPPCPSRTTSRLLSSRPPQTILVPYGRSTAVPSPAAVSWATRTRRPTRQTTVVDRRRLFPRRRLPSLLRPFLTIFADFRSFARTHTRSFSLLSLNSVNNLPLHCRTDLSSFYGLRTKTSHCTDLPMNGLSISASFFSNSLPGDEFV